MRNCCGIWPLIFLLGVGLPTKVMGQVKFSYQHYLGRLVWQYLWEWGISLPSLVGPQEPSPDSQGWKSTMLHAVSIAQRWRGTHHCFNLHGREIRRIPLTGSSEEIGQGGVGFGCEGYLLSVFAMEEGSSP